MTPITQTSDTIRENLMNPHTGIIKLVSGIDGDAFADGILAAQGGYPSRASGATAPTGSTNTSDDPDDNVDLTRVEAAAIAGTDKPKADLARARYLAKTARPLLMELRDLADRYSPPPKPNRTKKDTTEQDILGADGKPMWCRSCMKLKHCEPIDKRYQGLALCRWCGDWRAANHDELPPDDLLAKRHRGERITERDHQRWRDRVAAEKSKGGKNRKGRRR